MLTPDISAVNLMFEILWNIFFIHSMECYLVFFCKYKINYFSITAFPDFPSIRIEKGTSLETCVKNSPLLNTFSDRIKSQSIKDSLLWWNGMFRYPIFRVTRLWKKWDPWDGSISKSCIPVSIIILALFISPQFTGIPRNLSLVPHRPGPIRI